MEEKKITRKSFLSNTVKYAAGAAVGVTGLNALSGGKIFAGTNNFTWPYPYETLDAEVVRLKAHKLYFGGKDCCAGVFGGIVEALAEKIGDPWTNFPIEVMLYGRGGGVGWGTTCGVINGGAALISLVTEKSPSGPLINELWAKYTTESLPTAAANAASYETPLVTGDLHSNVSGSPLCHASVSQWCNAGTTKFKVGDPERKERCARLAGDFAAFTVEILNAHFANSFESTYDFSEKGCTAACHTDGAIIGNVMTNMECQSCHKEAHNANYTAVNSLNNVPNTFELEQNFPNPFNPSTNMVFKLKDESKVRLEVYDVRGQLVKALVDSEVMAGGTYQATWNGTNNAGAKVASGVYFARFTTADYMKTIKMNLVK